MTLEAFDVAVIGAGIHGAGVAQAAAAAGHRVLLLEKTHPAAGTSSCSSKLIHGGLRYLESGQLALVRESLRERELLLRNAPELVRLLPFYIPVYRETSRRPWMLYAGLALYALLGGLAANTRFGSVPRPAWHGLGALREEGLQAIFTYFDAQTDDASLTNAVVRSARNLGCVLHAPARFDHAERLERGYRLSYRTDAESRQCLAATVVNAAGPWVNLVQSRCAPQPPSAEVELVQGAHLVYDQPVAAGVFYVESVRDGRPIFVMPWREGMLIGTTETPHTGDPDRVEARPEEIVYLQETLAAYFPRYAGRMMSAMAGLRVLPKAAREAHRRPRDALLLGDDDRRPRWIAIYGGKLTAYRATAARTLRRLAPSLPARRPVADTRALRLTAR